MGYELNAILSTIGDTQEFLVAPGRSSIDRVLDAIAAAFPTSITPAFATPYRGAFLAPDEAVVLFDAWAKDLAVLADADFESDGTARFGDGLDDGVVDVLAMIVPRMRDLAAQGYNVAFEAG